MDAAGAIQHDKWLGMYRWGGDRVGPVLLYYYFIITKNYKESYIWHQPVHRRACNPRVPYWARARGGPKTGVPETQFVISVSLIIRFWRHVV